MQSEIIDGTSSSIEFLKNKGYEFFVTESYYSKFEGLLKYIDIFAQKISRLFGIKDLAMVKKEVFERKDYANIFAKNPSKT